MRGSIGNLKVIHNEPKLIHKHTKGYAYMRNQQVSIGIHEASKGNPDGIHRAYMGNLYGSHGGTIGEFIGNPQGAHQESIRNT